MSVNASRARRLVHLELHTPDQVAASASYARLLGWRPELVKTGSGSYLSLDLGGGVTGGIVECGAPRPLWLPYVEVGEVHERTEQARQLGAGGLLEPREGPAGWRSVVSMPQGGELAFWQPKR